MQLLRYIVLVACLLSWPGNAFARCEGSVILATIHDAYLKTLAEVGVQRRHAAIALLFSVGGQDAEQFAKQIERSGAQISQHRLAEILQAAQSLAESVLDDGISTDQDTHQANTDWLGQTVLETDCMSSRARATRAASTQGPSMLGVNKPATSKQFWGTLNDIDQGAKSLAALIVVCLVGGMAFAAYRFWHSPLLRRKRLERMPRRPINLTFELTYTTPEGNIAQTTVKAVDISTGGMKLDWSPPAPNGTLLTLSLPIGTRAAQVAWGNAFFAGVMLDTQLSANELQTLQNS